MFGIFSLTIARYRREPNGENGLVSEDGYTIQCGPLLDAQIHAIYIPSRSIEADWSVYLGWVGVAFCFLSALCVYILSKLMRNAHFLT